MVSSDYNLDYNDEYYEINDDENEEKETMNEDIKWTQEELATIQALRYKGYAIIIWTPDELQGVDPDIIQDASISFGWDKIQNQLENEK
jgi:hypothetical protein